MAPPTKMITVENLAVELLDFTPVKTWWSPIFRVYSLPVLNPADMVPIYLLGVARRVANAAKHGTMGILILRLSMSSIRLLLNSNITAKF